jgi:hypothetical protein
VFTDHKQKNLVQDVLGLTSDCMCQLRLHVCIKGIHNAIADAISWLEYDPLVNQRDESYFITKVNKNSKCSQRQNWMAVSKHWCKPKVDTNKHEDLNLVFTNHREEDKIYPVTTIEIAKAQNKRSRTKDLL